MGRLKCRDGMGGSGGCQRDKRERERERERERVNERERGVVVSEKNEKIMK